VKDRARSRVPLGLSEATERQSSALDSAALHKDTVPEGLRKNIVEVSGLNSDRAVHV
jgi:hypothetical protein